MCLWKQIRALNEETEGSAKTVFKPQDQRHDKSTFVESQEDDPELIIEVPFVNGVKVKSITISGEQGEKHPSKCKLFINRDDIDFSNAHDLPATQTLDLNEDIDAEYEYPLKTSKFYSVQSLTLFFPESFGMDRTKIFYIGLKGVNMKFKRDIVEAVYESRPTAEDTRARGDEFSGDISETATYGS